MQFQRLQARTISCMLSIHLGPIAICPPDTNSCTLNTRVIACLMRCWNYMHFQGLNDSWTCGSQKPRTRQGKKGNHACSYDLQGNLANHAPLSLKGSQGVWKLGRTNPHICSRAPDIKDALDSFPRLYQYMEIDDRQFRESNQSLRPVNNPDHQRNAIIACRCIKYESVSRFLLFALNYLPPWIIWSFLPEMI